MTVKEPIWNIKPDFNAADKQEMKAIQNFDRLVSPDSSSYANFFEHCGGRDRRRGPGLK